MAIGWLFLVIGWNIIWAITDYNKGENYWERWKFIPITIYNISGVVALIFYCL
jgi:hypothetical protein